MKRNDQAPEICILYVDEADLITTSYTGGDDEEDPEQDREYTKNYSL